MPLKQQDVPCWVIAHPDGTLAGQWEERHFSDEDEAAEVLDCEREQDAGLATAAPRALSAPCLTIVCDGCGEPYRGWPDDHLIDHFTSAADASWHSGDTEFRADGTTWCENCRSAVPESVRMAPSEEETGR